MSCIHHYRLDPPSGAIVAGVCRKCGEQRAFPSEEGVKGTWRKWAGDPKASPRRRAAEAKSVRAG